MTARPDGSDATERARTRIWRAAGVIATGGFLAGLVLLVLAVFLPLPGLLSRYNDTSAWEPITLQVLLGVLAFGAWAWPNRHRDRAFALVFLALGTATVLLLGTAGFLRCQDPTLSSGWSVVSRVIGFLVGTYDVQDFQSGRCGSGVPLALQFARLVQFIVLLVAASRAVAALLRGQLDRILVRLARRIVLVVGADSMSASLLRALAAEPGSAAHVIVTGDVAAPWVRSARAAGWRVVAGDPTDVRVLRPLVRRGRRHALRSLAVLAADSTATQRLVRTVERSVERPIERDVDGTAATAPVRALLRIDDAWQAEDWRRRYLGRAAEWVVDTISADEVTARLIVEDALRAGSDRLVVAGHGGLTFAVLAEVAQQSRERLVLGDAAVPDVVLLDPAASDILEQHGFSQRRFGNQVGLRARAVDEVAKPETIASAVEGAAAPAILFTTQPAAEATDETWQRLAVMLGAHAPERLIYSRRTDVTGLGTEPLLARVYAFGSTLDAGGRPVGTWERIARLGHERYIRAHPDPDIPSRRPWDALAPFYRDSNVRQVLATLESAVAVGRSWGAGGVAAEGAQGAAGAEGAASQAASVPDDEQLARMAELEHESWRRHLIDSGWRFGATRDDGRRRHPDLVPWAGLGEEAREKTRAGVTTSLELLALLGYRSFDDPAQPWRTVRRRGEVWARRRDAAWEWTTHSGQRLRGAAGDWEVLDSRGRSHSVTPEVFELSHERIDENHWRRTGTVGVRPARPAERIETLEGPVIANAGEWVVRGSLGDEWVISAERLAAGYELDDLAP